MIELNGYIPPAKGERYQVKKVWVNPKLITHMSQCAVMAERAIDGKYLPEKILATEVSFAAAFAEEFVGVTVLNTPYEILNLIHFWSIDNVPGYWELHK